MIREELHDVNGRTVEVRRTGSGEPVVYFHSAIGDFWIPEFLEPLSERFEIISPARPGFGQSTGVEEIADVEDLAFHYDDLFRDLQITKPHLIGLSLGGWIAAEYAVRWPDGISSLTLIDSAGLWLDEAPIGQLWGVQPEALVDLLFEDHEFPLAQLLLSIDLDNPPPEEILLQFINNQAATARIAWNPYLHNPKLVTRLHRISCPTLVIWGSNDKLIPPAHAKEFTRLIRNARLETVPGGHLTAMENPSSVGQILASFESFNG